MDKNLINRIKKLMLEEYSIESDSEKLFGKSTPLENQFSDLMVSKLMDDDEIVVYKWSAYNTILIELKYNNEDSLIKEIIYRITDGENPDKVFMDIFPRAKQTNELLRLKNIIYEYKDINSMDEL